MYNIWERIKTRILNIVKSRLFVMAVAFCILFAILVQRLFMLQIVNGQKYLDDYKLHIKKTKEMQGTRGRILDRNGKVLADNVLAYSVTIEDNGEYDKAEEKNKVLNETIMKVIDIVEKNGDSVISDFGIILNDSGEYQYVDSGTRQQRFLADVFGEKTIDKLGDRAKYTATQLMDYLCSKKNYCYDLDQNKYSKEMILKIVNIRYAVSLNSYQKYLETTIAKDISEVTMAEIMENQDSLQGVSIKDDSIRKYYDSEYFASVLGYTGQISQEEYDDLDKKQKEDYSLTDVVGKSGIEKTLDDQLQGEKGSVTLYVNNVGKVLETEQGKDPKAGNDVYLSIDADLQVMAYNILEEKLAGILLTKLVNSMTFDRTQVGKNKDLRTPIGDVYNAFFQNDIIDTSRFDTKAAKQYEKEIFSTYQQEIDQVLKSITTGVGSSDGDKYSELSQEMQAYLTYICSTFLTDKAAILSSGQIDTADPTYTAWTTDGSINLYEYLNYAISKHWVDSSKLADYMDGDSKYSDREEVYQGILNYLNEKLRTDSDFKKLIYKYMIRNEKITGKQVCLVLYEQKVLKTDAKQFQNLESGATKAYDFIRGKIETLEITPGQLGLEPCSGSFVMTDSKTGKLLACVSYPGYDSNKLANSTDSKYFAMLNSSSASPLYNRATQEKTAPGSTYKPLTAVAGLTEGVIDLGTYVTCTGTYTKADRNPKCWIYPRSHGSLAIEGAIRHSCNIFFYEVGFRLGLKRGALDADSDNAAKASFSHDRGLGILRDYATQFGMSEQTGIEIPESEGKISDADAVRSAIGQGTNNYTTTQMARFITAIANKGTLYNLTLLDKSTDVNGKTIEEYEPVVGNKIEGVASTTWNAVHNGMKAVVSSSSVYSSVTNSGLSFSGKTGTAQQSKTHPDHALFVGFAPSDNPEVAFACRIANGYSSQYAAEVGRDVMKYYYELADDEDIVKGQASSVTENVSGD